MDVEIGECDLKLQSQKPCNLKKQSFSGHLDSPRRSESDRQVKRTPSAKGRSSLTSKGSPGRFVPRRKSLNFEAAHFMVSSPARSPASDADDDVFEDTKLTPPIRKARKALCKKRMACLSQGATEENMLFKSSRTPSKNDRTRSEGNSCDFENAFRRSSRTLPRHPERILDLPDIEDNFFTHTVAWSSSNRFVVGLQNSLFLCNEQGTQSSLLQKNKLASYSSVVCNPSGDTALTGLSGVLQLWDLNTQKMICSVPHRHATGEGHEPDSFCRINCVAWSPTNFDLFNSGCRAGQIDHFDRRCTAAGPTTSVSPQGYYSSICNIQYCRSGRYIATGGIEMMLKVWDVSQPMKPFFHKEAHTSAIRALAWHPSRNSELVSGGGIDDQHLRFWNIHNGKMLSEKNLKAQLCSILWSPLTNELISSQSMKGRHSVTVWDYPTMELVGNLPGHLGRVLHLALSPCKRFLATCCADEALRIWKIVKRAVNPGGENLTPSKSLSSSFMYIR